jgi:hypothetical protein
MFRTSIRCMTSISAQLKEQKRISMVNRDCATIISRLKCSIDQCDTTTHRLEVDWELWYDERQFRGSRQTRSSHAMTQHYLHQINEHFPDIKCPSTLTMYSTGGPKYYIMYGITTNGSVKFH